jgi:hypothetical protein
MSRVTGNPRSRPAVLFAVAALIVAVGVGGTVLASNVLG